MAIRSSGARPRLEARSARRLFLHAHGLLDPPSGSGRGADLLGVIERLGFVQVDSINTVARAHDLILFSRRSAYRPEYLKHLYEREHALFEHWTHDAAVIPKRYFPYWHLRFQRDARVLDSQWRKWGRSGFEARTEEIVRHIRNHGPVCSADLARGEKQRSDGWWDWHPSKTALEFLWRTGVLAVAGRDGFRKRYDLIERVIDECLLDKGSRPSESETVDWLCNTAVDCQGFATSGEIAAFWDTVTPDEAKVWCAARLAEGVLEEMDIVSHDGSRRRVLARPEAIQRAPGLSDPPRRLRVLSPFDPALRNRIRAERIFGFSYRIEVFVPAHRRIYGYYVFPLLEGDRIVGRIDMKADRNGKCLDVAALWPERGVSWGSGRQRRLEAELARVARLANVETVVFADGWLRAPK